MLSKIAASAATIALVMSPAYANPNTTNISEGYSIKGNLSLITSSGLGSDSECKGYKGYSDIYGGQQILIKDGKGEVIAVGSLGKGVRDSQYPNVACNLSIIVNNIPHSDFYQIVLGSGRRGSLTYSKQELQTKQWSVDVLLSDD